ncbi:MAG TPA: hypothetical protein VIF14_09335 [Alphaproteobacteria bacterium]|jgi:hypothetical protein
MRVRTTLRIAALLAALLAFAGTASAEALRNWRLSFEVLSSQHALPAEGRKPSYAEKDALTRAVLAEIVPHVWTTLGATAARARSRVLAGGYGDDVNPAIHSSIQTSEAEARRLAAALGYVFRQYAVIMYDLAAPQSEVRQVSARFARGALTPALATRFFGLARRQLKSDKLGFSATRSRMIFINLNTGIADDAFAEGLARAAAEWPEAGIKIDPPKPVRALLIKNDWDKAKSGEDYVRLLDPTGERLVAALVVLQRRHDGRVRRWLAFLQPSRPPPQRPAPQPAPAQPRP